jgi:hypothetical protein
MAKFISRALDGDVCAECGVRDDVVVVDIGYKRGMCRSCGEKWVQWCASKGIDWNPWESPKPNKKDRSDALEDLWRAKERLTRGLELLSSALHNLSDGLALLMEDESDD